MSLLGVLCFLYPTLFTTAELREAYEVGQIRFLLRITLIGSVAFGLFNMARLQNARLGAVGLLCAGAAFLLGGWQAEVGTLDPTKVGLGLDWLLLDLLASAGLFIFLEKLFPRYPDQAILRPELSLDVVYFGMNHLALGFLLIASNGFAPAAVDWAVNAELQAFVTGLPIWGQVILLVFAADLVQYWIHRAYHEVPWLWGLHAVHHSTEHMDWIAGSRTHILQTLFDRTLVFLPLYLLGPSKEALDVYVVYAALLAVFIHSNVGLPMGPLKWIITTPQFHHWHHSSDQPAIDTNYAAYLPLYDWLFGTFHMPDAHWPIKYGTLTRLPRTFWGQFAYPFQRDRGRGDADAGTPEEASAGS
ncbi:MAG: sterol desaturase family protein [Deltaproteobacteria bacterium]|nr:sterol desaturase family protein [Deltaproteobacteria bacterium]